MHKPKFAAACAALLILPSAFAEIPADSEIIVTAKGIQTTADALVTSHVLTAQQIEATQANDIPALLSQITGINVNDSGGRGSQTSVFLRGTASSQTIVLIDGVRVGSATLGSAALNSYPIEAIDRIEIVKGPFSGIYGADAVGGVIQLFTRKGGNGRGSVSATLGSHSLSEYGLALNGGNERHSFRISAHAEDVDGIDRTSIQTGGNDDRDGFEESALSIAGRTRFGEHTQADLSVLYTDNTAEFDNTFGDDTGFFTDTETLSTALNLDSTLTDTLRWRNTLGINKDESVTPAFFSDITTNRDSVGSELVFDFGANNILTVGADYYQEDIETSSDFPVTDRDNTGVYTQLQLRGDTLSMVGSLRYDDNSAYGEDTNGSLAVNYDFTDRLRAVVSYGTAFVAPSFNQLYFPFFGNPDLQPEESESFEVSLLGSNDHLSWRLSAYRTDITNLFSFDPVTFLAANIGEAEVEGVELELGTVVADWELALNVDLLSAEDKDTGIELDDRAEQTLSISAARTFGDLDVRLDFRAESGRFDLRGTELAGHGLLDINARYQVNEQISLLANIDNVFDKDYTVNLISPTERYLTEGRLAKLTIKWEF